MFEFIMLLVACFLLVFCTTMLIRTTKINDISFFPLTCYSIGEALGGAILITYL